MTSFVGEEPIIVLRRTLVGQDKAGRPEGIEVETFGENRPVVLATVNPVAGELLDSIPPGEELAHHRQCITNFALRTSDEQQRTFPDWVAYRGDVYTVRDIKAYARVIPYTQAHLRRVNVVEAEQEMRHHMDDYHGSKLEAALQGDLG